ncbi:MAG: TnpV protein [Lachnospiraceae bacterium]
MTRRMSTCWTLTTRLMDWLDRMIPQMAEAAGASEELKARDQMAWVRLMNNCKARVEEIICAEIIYC